MLSSTWTLALLPEYDNANLGEALTRAVYAHEGVLAEGKTGRGLMGTLEGWKQRARQLKQDLHALYIACRDPRVPWYAKALAACVTAYALSPIDLIPDFIPVLGYVDDLIIVPAGIALVLRMIPPVIMAESREKARRLAETPTSWVAAGVFIGIWIVSALAITFLLLRVFRT